MKTIAKTLESIANSSRKILLTLATGFFVYAAPFLKTAFGDIHIINPSMSVETINSVIENSSPGDTIQAQDGTYNINHPMKFFSFLPDRNYVFGTATISGSGLEQESLIAIVNGGNINIGATKNLTLQKTKIGFWIADVPYDKINIANINFNEIYENAIVMENREHISALIEPAVNISYCASDSGGKFIMYAYGAGVSEKSPFFSAKNSSLSNLTSDGGAIDVPAYYRDGEWIMLGTNYISNNLVINCRKGLSDPRNYWKYSSPSNIAQRDVPSDAVLITGAVYYDNYGNPHVFDGENCFVTDANSFVPNTNIPKRNSRLNLGNGNYIGAIEPYHNLEGNLDFDEDVDFSDFVIATRKYNGNINDISPVINDWLYTEPNDPNGNPK